MLAVAALVAAGCYNGRTGPAARPGISEDQMKTDSHPGKVIVRFLAPGGEPTAPETVDKVVKTDAEWQRVLTPEQYRVTRGKGTEPAFCGGLLHEKQAGVYKCVDCGLPLFSSAAKFESGTGWPSFFAPFDRAHIAFIEDNSYGMRRVEIRCKRCDDHLGHVFPDGPRPTGERYCLNSASLSFVDEGGAIELRR